MLNSHAPRAFALVVGAVAEGAGFRGMVGGQVVDIEMGEGVWQKQKPKKQAEILRAIHENKTAALIRASVTAGALLAGAGQAKVKRLAEYGRKIGLAFQVADDILDILGDKKLLGKKGSDAANRKLTFPAVYGIEGSRKQAARLIEEAKDLVRPFGARAALLQDLADYIIARTY